MWNTRPSIEKTGFEWVEDVESKGSQRLKDSWWRQQLESLKPVPPPPLDAGLGRYERAVCGVSAVALRKGLRPRHVQMIALCGAIGSGLYITTGRAIYCAGPGGLLIGLMVLSVLMLLTMNSAAELAVEFPSAGAFSAHATRFVDISWGFVIGWLYAIEYLISLPTELNAVFLILRQWDYDHYKIITLIVVAVSLVVLFGLHLFDVGLFGEIEFAMSVFQLVVLLIFIISSIAIICGVNSEQYYYGVKYFTDPGAFVQGAKGVFLVFVGCSWAYLGTEICVLTVAETQNVQIAMPRAVKQVFWRCIFIYMCCAVCLCCLIAYDNERLTQNSRSTVIFLLAIKLMGNRGLLCFFRVAILVSLIGSGYSAIYASTRTLVSLSAQGHAPKFLGRIDQKGRPLPALGVAFLFGLIGFISPNLKDGVVFFWLSNLGGITGLVMWLSINIHHIRFRLASKAQGRTLETLLCKSMFGLAGSVAAVIAIIVILGLQFWTALYSEDQLVSSTPSPPHLFLVFLGVFVAVGLFLIHKLVFRDGFIGLKDIDLCTGRRIHDTEAERIAVMVERQYIKDKPWWYRLYRFWC